MGLAPNGFRRYGLAHLKALKVSADRVASVSDIPIIMVKAKAIALDGPKVCHL